MHAIIMSVEHTSSLLQLDSHVRSVILVIFRSRAPWKMEACFLATRKFPGGYDLPSIRLDVHRFTSKAIISTRLMISSTLSFLVPVNVL